MFCRKGGKILELVAQKGGGISSLGIVQELSENGPEQLDFIELALSKGVGLETSTGTFHLNYSEILFYN